MNRQWKMVLVFAAAAVCWLNGCMIRQSVLPESAQKAERVDQVKEKITFEGQDMEGNSVSSAVFSETELTMVNVWATYCNPCLREMPGLGELAEAYAEDEFRILGIISDVQEDASQEMLDYAAELIAQTGAAYPHLLLNESIYRSLLNGVTAVPTTFFFNSEGELLDTVIGSMEKDEWKEKIDALLEK